MLNPLVVPAGEKGAKAVEPGACHVKTSCTYLKKTEYYNFVKL